MIKAAMQGDRRAQYNLGKMYRDGVGFEKNIKTSVTWFRSAAGRGHVRAQSKLGRRYAAGVGVAQNDVMALKWSLLAAQHGDKAAKDTVKILKARMSKAGIDNAARQAANWTPDRK
jgi:TPR repeat protein